MEHAAKRAKLAPSTSSEDQTIAAACFREVQCLLTQSSLSPVHDGSSGRAAASTTTTIHMLPVGNSTERMKSYLDYHGFRTAIVRSPREAISIYKDSCILRAGHDETHDKAKLLAMLGTHPAQDMLESLYANHVKQIYCLLLYCQRIREACTTAVEYSTDLVSMLDANEQDCLAAGYSASNDDATTRISFDMDQCRRLSSQVSERVIRLMQSILQADHLIRPDQLQHEYERIVWHNTTYANAIFQKWLCDNNTCVKDIYYKRSHIPKYERFTVYLYDSHLDPLRPPPFVWMPSLSLAIEKGPEAMAQAMTGAFWSHLLRRGYFATEKMQTDLSPELEKYFLFGISNDLTVPLLLNAHFQPTYPLCYYFHGKAGSGKSSLARNFSYALNATIEDLVDPEIMVRVVKQNLNKPYDVLELEFDLRPNNNDLSVMSIIQGAT
eukprot:scaffold5108_cov172-Amphora_coffeaeformis.AAC.25